MKKLVKNPLDRELKVMFKGKNFVLAPNEGKELDNDLAVYWKKLHSFLEVEELPSPNLSLMEPPKPEVKEIPPEPSVNDELNKPKVKVGKPKKIK